MSSVSTNLISEAKTLSMDILSVSKDSIERGLPRTGNRINRMLVAPFFISLDTIFAFGIATDDKKLQKIKEKLMTLDTVELYSSELNYNKTIIARDFLKEVYTKERNYTSTAKKIKEFAARSSMIFSLGVAMFVGTSLGQVFFVGDSFVRSPPHLQFAAKTATVIGSLTTLPVIAYGFYHWLVEGSKLDGAKQELAQQALRQLSV